MGPDRGEVQMVADVALPETTPVQPVHSVKSVNTIQALSLTTKVTRFHLFVVALLACHCPAQPLGRSYRARLSADLDQTTVDTSKGVCGDGRHLHPRPPRLDFVWHRFTYWADGVQAFIPHDKRIMFVASCHVLWHPLKLVRTESLDVSFLHVAFALQARAARSGWLQQNDWLAAHAHPPTADPYLPIIGCRAPPAATLGNTKLLLPARRQKSLNLPVPVCLSKAHRRPITVASAGAMG